MATFLRSRACNQTNPPEIRTYGVLCTYDPLKVLILSHANITVTNNYVMVIVILFIKILESKVIKSLVLHLLRFSLSLFCTPPPTGKQIQGISLYFDTLYPHFFSCPFFLNPNFFSPPFFSQSPKNFQPHFFTPFFCNSIFLPQTFFTYIFLHPLFFTHIFFTSKFYVTKITEGNTIQDRSFFEQITPVLHLSRSVNS